MTLRIDTSLNEYIEVAIILGSGRILAMKKIRAARKQSEKLLALIDSLLKENNANLAEIKKIAVADRGGSFTSLRIGAATANALGYAIGAKVRSLPVSGPANQKKKISRKKSALGFDIVEPVYDRGPNIGGKSSKSS
jgi:tRNA A37 threonylcarbamoyladenosine modification protein TsaB